MSAALLIIYFSFFSPNTLAKIFNMNKNKAMNDQLTQLFII